MRADRKKLYKTFEDDHLIKLAYQRVTLVKNSDGPADKESAEKAVEDICLEIAVRIHDKNFNIQKLGWYYNIMFSDPDLEFKNGVNAGMRVGLVCRDNKWVLYAKDEGGIFTQMVKNSQQVGVLNEIAKKYEFKKTGIQDDGDKVELEKIANSFVNGTHIKGIEQDGATKVLLDKVGKFSTELTREKKAQVEKARGAQLQSKDETINKQQSPDVLNVGNREQVRKLEPQESTQERDVQQKIEQKAQAVSLDQPESHDKSKAAHDDICKLVDTDRQKIETEYKQLRKKIIASYSKGLPELRDLTDADAAELKEQMEDGTQSRFYGVWVTSPVYLYPDPCYLGDKSGSEAYLPLYSVGGRFSTKSDDVDYVAPYYFTPNKKHEYPDLPTINNKRFPEKVENKINELFGMINALRRTVKDLRSSNKNEVNVEAVKRAQIAFQNKPSKKAAEAVYQAVKSSRPDKKDVSVALQDKRLEDTDGAVDQVRKDVKSSKEEASRSAVDRKQKKEGSIDQEIKALKFDIGLVDRMLTEFKKAPSEHNKQRAFNKLKEIGEAIYSEKISVDDFLKEASPQVVSYIEKYFQVKKYEKELKNLRQEAGQYENNIKDLQESNNEKIADINKSVNAKDLEIQSYEHGLEGKMAYTIELRQIRENDGEEASDELGDSYKQLGLDKNGKKILKGADAYKQFMNSVKENVSKDKENSKNIVFIVVKEATDSEKKTYKKVCERVIDYSPSHAISDTGDHVKPLFSDSTTLEREKKELETKRAKLEKSNTGLEEKAIKIKALTDKLDEKIKELTEESKELLTWKPEVLRRRITVLNELRGSLSRMPGTEKDGVATVVKTWREHKGNSAVFQERRFTLFGFKFSGDEKKTAMEKWVDEDLVQIAKPNP